MLGPSGSGKTTCLRLIAGFEQPTAGHIEIFGETAEGVPPYRRNVNTVFQDYALFPHLNVLDNVAYGLMVKGVGKAERRKAAEEALALVKLPGYGARRPGQLSGGQRQRVALARALVNRPKVLLLDEPLGALDLKLREQMQEELKTLQKSLGITFVFVTHDQGEALSMADRVAVFNDGRIMQVGTPEEIYQRPHTRFVADFVGSSNVLPPDSSSAMPARRRWAQPAAGEDRSRRRRRRARRRHVGARAVALSYQGADRPARASTTRERAPQRRRVPSRRKRRAAPKAEAVTLSFAAERPAPDGGAGMSLAGAAGLGRRRRSCRGRRRRARRALRPVLAAAEFLLLLHAAAAAPVARHRLSRLAVRAAAAELLLDRRVLRPDQPRVHAQDLRRAAAAGQSRHHPAHRHDGGDGHARLGDRRLPDRLFRGALCAGQMEGAVLSRRHAAAVVELPGQDLCLEADPRQGRHPHLAVRASCICRGCSTPGCRSR